MLNKAKLESELVDVFTEPSYQSPIEVANAWGNAYDAYARDATDASFDRVAVVNKPGFISGMSSFSAQAGTPPSFAQLLDTAFVAYWTGAVFAVGVPPTPAAKCPSVGGNTIFSLEISSTVIVAAPGVLLSNLLPIFSNVTEGQTIRDQARKIADAFHQATTTAVTVLITGLDTTPPPAGPLPIMNQCGLF